MHESRNVRVTRPKGGGFTKGNRNSLATAPDRSAFIKPHERPFGVPVPTAATLNAVASREASRIVYGGYSSKKHALCGVCLIYKARNGSCSCD